VAFFLCPPFSDSPHDSRVRSIEDYHRQPAISAVPDFRHQSDHPSQLPAINPTNFPSPAVILNAVKDHET
jgi:hypothetical protein